MFILISRVFWESQEEDKFDKFMDRLVNETISNVSMNFVSGLKAY